MGIMEDSWKKIEEQLYEIDAFKCLNLERRKEIIDILKTFYSLGFQHGYDYAVSIIAYMNSLNKQSYAYQ